MIPSDLGPSDAGVLLDITDLGHVLRWDGAQWVFASGDAGSGYLAEFKVAPQAAGWARCDGTASSYLKVGTTVTLANISLPTKSGLWYLRR